MSQEHVQENWRVIHRFAAVNFCLEITRSSDWLFCIVGFLCCVMRRCC